MPTPTPPGDDEVPSASGAPPPRYFDLERLLRVLGEHGVAYVLVGGVAARAHGATLFTDDVDICYERSQPNARALARAVRALNAVLDLGGRAANPPDARSLELGDMFLFETDAGGLDCLARPDGTEGYDDLIRNAIRVDYAGVTVSVAALDDLVRMARATAETNPLRRAGEERKLAILLALREEVDAQGAPTEPGPHVLVRGYRRADGTSVREHWRRPARRSRPSVAAPGES